MSLRTRTDVLLLAGFCAFLFFYGLGAFGLIGADEPRYAQVAREMLDHHEWTTPLLYGRPWLEKPPLYYWQAMLTYSVLGVTDTAARVPSAIDATLLVVAVYLFFRRFRPGVEVDAALITASCAGVIGYARAASTDMPLAATFSFGMLAWWAWRESGKRIYLALFYFCMALGMLAKGPVAPFLAVLVIVLFAAITRGWHRLGRTLWLPGILLFGAVALPWYVAVQMRNPQFFREFILEHNLARFSTNLYHHPEPFWYYVPVTLLALVPWLVFAIAALIRPVRIWWAERKTVSSGPDLDLQFNLFACCWLVVPVVFFSLSRSKLPGYILPSVPAAAVLFANYLRQQFDAQEPLSRWMSALHALVAAAPIVPAILIGYIITERSLPKDQPMLHAVTLKPWLFALAIALVLCLAIAYTLMSRLGLRMLRFVTLIPVVLAVAAVLKLGSTAIDQTLSARPLAAELAAVETQPLPVAVCGTSRELEYGLIFYLNQAITRCEFSPLPESEHLVVAPSILKYNVAEKAGGRRVMYLGHYAPQDVDYYWIARAGKN